MVIEERALARWIDNFYGYGSWHARFWFVGYEEGGGDVPEEVAEKLNYFYHEHRADKAVLCDLRRLYQRVAFRVEGPRAEKFATLGDQRFGSQATLHGGWKNLIAFGAGYRDEKNTGSAGISKKNICFVDRAERGVDSVVSPAGP
jgi:hypothetical protein